MDSSRPYLELPLSMQHSSVTGSKERVPENDFQQISSQTLLDFLPSLHNVPKGGLDLPEFNLPSNENMQGGLLSSFKVNDGCNLLLNPFADSQQLGHGLLYGQRNEMQVNDTSSHSGNILSDPNYLNMNTSAVPHHSQGPEISLSSHIFSKNVESPTAVPSNFSSAMLPFNSSYEDSQFNKNFEQLEAITKHIKSDNSPLVKEEGTIATKSDQSCSVECGDSVSPVCDIGAPRVNSLISDSSEPNLGNISDEKLNLKDLDHIDLQQLNSEEVKVVESVVTCAFCPRSFKTQEQLSKHEALHPYQTSAIQCSKCGEILGNYMLLQEHKQYEDYLSSCDLCGQLFPNEECMICHIRNAHNDVDDIFDDENNASEDLHGPPKNSTEAPTESFEEALFNQSSVLEDQAESNEKYDLTPPPPEEQVTADDNHDNETNEELTPSHFEEANVDSNIQPTAVLENIIESSNMEADGPYSEELENTVEQSVCLNEHLPETAPSKPKKTKCRYCSKKCSTRKSLVRHERSHPYATAAMKCNLCLEVVENYKAFKVHKKNLGTPVSCITCNQVCPNENCLKCHVRNVHNNFVYGAPPVYNLDDSNDDAYEVEGEEEEEGDSDSGALSAQQYSVSKYTVGDPGAPLRITIKQEKEETYVAPVSPSYSAPTPPTPSTPSPQGAPTPSPPAYVYESEPSDDADNDQEYEPYASDHSVEIQSKKHLRRKTALRSSKKSGVHFLSSSEESDHDESADFNYSPQTNSESEENSDEDPEWDQTENSFGNSKKRTRRKNPLSDDDSDVDPDWGQQTSSAGSKKRARRKKGPLSDDSDNDFDWSIPQTSFATSKKRSARKKSSLSDDDSDYDPDWKQDDNSSGSTKKKVPSRKSRKKTIQVAFFVPAIPVPKVKRPRARGLGGQKAQDAAAALAQAVEDMETIVPELKTVIKPVRRSVTKASLKTYSEMYDDEYDYDLVNVKPEPDVPGDSETLMQNEQDPNVPAAQTYSDSNNPYEFNDELDVSNSDISDKQNRSNIDSLNSDQQEEQIVVKAEPYDFHDDDEDNEDDDPSYGTDLYFSKKFCEPNLKYGNIKCPTTIKTDPDADEKPKKELRYVCKICGRALQYRSHLVRHLRRVHDGEGVEEVMRRLMKCRFCEKPYSNELSLINHEKLHDGTSKMKCNKCEERFDDKNALRRHQRKMHWEHQPVECEICKKQLSDNTCLKAHMKHMHGAEEKKVTVFTCETCGRQLHTKTAFQNHVASKCGTNLLFPCETCGKSFSFKGSLKAHQLLHTGVKSFLCKFCGKAFHQKGEMKRHERKHTGEKPFVCEVCGRAFAYRESLLGHSAVHTGIKPFPCKTCGMRFSCSGNLVKHRRSNNCKGFSEQGDITVVNLEGENTQESTSVSHALAVDKPADLLPETATKPPSVITGLSNENRNLVGENSSAPQISHSFTNETHKIKQEPVQTPIADIAQQIHQSAVNSVQTSTSSIVKLPPGISVKPASALQSTPKETKPLPDVNVSQYYQNSSSVNNRLMGHLNPMYDRHENNVATQNNYNSHNLGPSFSENHFRQSNQVNVNDRRYSQLSLEGYAGRPEQYFDHQSLMRHEMNRQVMERAADRQTPRFLDLRFSGVDSRNAMQSYHGPTLPHTSTYPNIHSGHLGNYAAAHSVNHSANPANMYGSNTMMAGSVGFPAFTANNHMAMGYGHNNPIPAHAVAHAGSYPTSHMSHLEALFGHFSQNAANNSLQRLSSQSAGSTASSNPSLPSNHRV
ncbi:uncharacterized protein LOC117649389 [Thrips palmi]|uniref:Uncharacterized protein LOC117649389 n=1 Tax=Thrips palmi TaxID=161013 RepID=A0A6P8ZSA9_THRPL|nr:uncharacterized protein LOC117649389 [Thrips palmi]